MGSVYYGYDPNDRLTLTSWVTGATLSSETYSYTSGTNRLASLTDSSGTRSISYDGRGNTSAETRPGSVAVSTSYDGYGRLLAYSRTGDPAQANAYNGLDDRVSVTSGSATRLFVYAPDGRQLGEYGTSASDVIAETIWLQPEVAISESQPLGGDDGIGGYAPLAVVTGSGTGTTLYWTHGNHMGVPTVTTDATGATATPPAYTMPGFPGQMRTLADLYYNRHRDYDSSTGRYIQADPIGLGGGNNLYLYAEANPLKYMDPLGLTTIRFERAKNRIRVKPDRGRAYYVPATSGRPGCGCDEIFRDEGPIPPGRYTLNKDNVTNPNRVGDILRNTQGDWGDWRVPLVPDRRTRTYGRSGFFLHGGSLPGSAGCIDIGGGLTGNALTDRVLRDIQSDPDGVIVVWVK